MNRRRYLQASVAGSLAALSGCTGAPFAGSDGDGDRNGRDEETTSDPSRRPNYGSLDLPIPKSELHRGAAKDAIPAITDPAFAPDWRDVEFDLADGDRVVGVARGDRARAYPLRILDWHEVVNDEFDGPLLVTYCPLCGSGVTAIRRVDGQPTAFGVSGYLYRSDLVLYDRATNTLWSQIAATGINGPRTGETLELVPSTLTTWAAWRSEYPGTTALLPPPASGTIVESAPRPYDGKAYRGYENSSRVGIGFNDFDDDRLHPKAQVMGVATDDAATAYPFETVASAGVVNDAVGDLPVVVAATEDGTMVAYDRRVEGRTLQFRPAGDGRMTGGDATWRILTGRAVDGRFEGARLTRANAATTTFWFAWADFHPETAVYGRS